ncbi:MAG: 2-oxoacid:acceptor oxidoreductase family protein [Holophagales bacterium]|jgi:2-oxoisovalerate ferredoxin oxidoreductase beta subunit|nr:2-oxoacid:acceptor oxidoreductase family protein [Holophagales bacterium]
MSTAFYSKFERHSNGEGLKGNSTHYCPGCGHGLVHKYLSEAIAELGIQDDTVLVSPVGCSVFAYYYFDTGNTQAAHGRAAAVAIGHKLANPRTSVIAYQGDGDLASIGLAETIAAAQLGTPISIIFINNAIYGMTGGQMAPTTLMGQSTSTSPYGRKQIHGQPIKMAEQIALLDGPVYVERVALFSPAERNKAKKAIKKAIQLQSEGRGYTFIEVLAECPTHLKISPSESEKAEKWVKENMVPIFPLGVKKDITLEPWWNIEPPKFNGEEFVKLIGGTTEKTERHCKAFPAHLHPADISLKLAGSGGDGAQTAAILIATAGINEGFDGTHIPAYGPESRGGTSYADVHIAKTEVLNPASPTPHILIAYNAPSLTKFGPTVAKNGFIIYDTLAPEPKSTDPSVKVIGVPFAEIANGLGKMVVKNIVSLGVLSAATDIFPRETFLAAVKQALKEKASLMPLNEEAFDLGYKAAKECMKAKGY